jgi:hypothetical protein
MADGSWLMAHGQWLMVLPNAFDHQGIDHQPSAISHQP